jgi:Rrf2 family cysteine metabolism transcriptional repressor
MKISTKGRYGLRVLVDIAAHQHTGPVILRDISSRQAISEKYLWQVINPLKAAGLVKSTRGAKGGYVLSKTPEKITLLDVISILEGPVSMVDCVVDPDKCGRSAACVTRWVWGKVEKDIKESMDNITLKEILDVQEKADASTSLSYII